VSRPKRLGCADPLKYLECLPQEGRGLGGMTAGQGAPAQAGQRVSLVPRTGDGAGQVQGLLVTLPGLPEVTADQVHHSPAVEGSDLATLVTEVAVDAQGLVQRLGRARVVTRQPPHSPEAGEDVRGGESGTGTRPAPAFCPPCSVNWDGTRQPTGGQA
jgi:hypothetical protein